MNVIISNERQEELSKLDIEIIKSIHGVFEADELVQMFSNFFFGRMILDLTALKDYKDVKNLQKLSMSLDVEKIIVLLPDVPECLAPRFLSRLISMGIYNFTTNLDGVNYLLTNPNTYRDVAHLHQIEEIPPTPTSPSSTEGVNRENMGAMNPYVSAGSFILGIKDVTEHSGATMLTYMLKNAIQKMGKSVIALEVEKKDFVYFNDKDMISVEKTNLANELLKRRDISVILVDMNKADVADLCTDVLYLVEPSTIKLNKLMRIDRKAFEKLAGKKVVINQNLLSDNDIRQFEYEAKIKVFSTLPPLDERVDNTEILQSLLNKVGIMNY